MTPYVQDPDFTRWCGDVLEVLVEICALAARRLSQLSLLADG